MKNLLNVTDLSAYLFCPRKYYFEKIKGMKEPPSKKMIEGRLKHEILELFSKKEREVVINIKNPEEVFERYTNFILDIANYHLEKNQLIIVRFKISPKDFKDKLVEIMHEDIVLRKESIKKSIQRGFIGNELWENLQPKYVSEMFVISEELGLKGRIDRTMFENNEIIPFELKTREIEKVYPSDEIQLTAYTMLLEGKYNTKIPFGIIESGTKKFQIEITHNMKNKVIEIIEQINNISQNIKYPSNFSKCQTCFLKEQCDELKD